MNDVDFQDVAESVSQVIDAAGIAVIVIGLVWATTVYARALMDRSETAYTGYRRRVGQAILLGLEFLVAADIIRTVAVQPTFESVGVLGLIVVVRTFLSFTLELEVSGRWPWQKERGAEGAVTASS